MKRPEPIQLPDQTQKKADSDLSYTQKLAATPFGWMWLMMPGFVIFLLSALSGVLLRNLGLSETVYGGVVIAGLLICVMLSFTLIAKAYLGQKP